MFRRLSGPFIVFSLLIHSSATVIVFAGGFESPGVGAKALGMGGAFIGLADDWTATYWNPAGLAQIQKSGIGTAVNRLIAKEYSSVSMANPTPPFTQTNVERGDAFINLGGEPSQFNVHESKMSIPLPSLGAYHRWGRWVGAVSIHAPLGFSSSIEDSSVNGLTGHFNAKGYVFMSGLSLANEVRPDVLLGAGIHVLTGHLERHALKLGNGYGFQSDSEGDDAATPQGVLGALFKLSPKFQFGAVYRTPAILKVSGNAQVSDTRFPLATPGGTLQNERSDFTTELYTPATYGFGIAYFPSARWTMTADWQGADWRLAKRKTTFDTPGTILRNSDFDAGWKFTHRVRLGSEFRPIPRWALRGGMMRDPQAMPDRAQSLTNIVDITRHFIDFGTGYDITPGFTLELTVQHGWGNRTINGTEFKRRSTSIIIGTDCRFN